MSESSLQATTAPLSDPLKEEATAAVEEEVIEATKSSSSNSIKMNHNHKNGDICWVAVLRDTVVLVETTAGDGSKDSCSKEEKEEKRQQKSALDVAIGELLGQPVNLGWQFYSPWQGEYKGIKFHVYDDDDHNKESSDGGDTGDDEKVIVWTFGCIYYTGVPPSSPDVGGSSSTTTTVVHRPRLQAFLEKIMLLTEPLRQTDVMWRHGEHYACQEIYSDMIWQRLQEEQLEYFQQAPAGAGGGMLDLDYSRTLTEVNRQVVNRHNQLMAEKDEMKRCKELALLQQMHELNQRLEQEQETSQSTNNTSSSNSKKWWRPSSSSVSSPSSSLQNVTGGNGVAQQLLAAASRQIFSTSFSSAESQSSSSSSINSMGGGESIATVDNEQQQQQQQDDMAPSSSKFQQQQQQQGGLLQNHHYYDDDVHSVESINAMSDVSSVCVEDILSQLEREVTFRDVHAHVVQHTGQQEQQETTIMPAHHHHPEEEKKEMDHDDDEWHEPQSDNSSNKLLHSHHGEAPKSPSSTMAVVLGV